jgi:hypothetical protein
MIDEAVMSVGPGETRVALLDAGKTMEFIVDRGGVGAGDVIEGRVTEISLTFGAAFVDIGQPLPGYLAKPKDLSVGATVLVAVTVGARPGKGAELKRAATGAKPLRRTPLARALAQCPGIARVAVDQSSALGPARGLFRGAVHVPRCFEESGAGEALDEALARRVALPGGAALIFAEAEAATLIDIDGGGIAPGAANAAALPEIARQLRLRGIAGHILVDVIPSRDRNAVTKLVSMMKEAVADDPAPTQVAGRTPLGMIELTRRRHGASLAEMMLDPLSAGPNALTIGLDGLRALLRESAARPGAPLSLAVAPRVARALDARPTALAEAGRAMGRPVVLIERGDIELFAIEELAR